MKLRTWSVLTVVCAVFGIAASPIAAATTFGDHGTAIPPIHVPGASGNPVAVLQQADGKVIVVGTAPGPVAPTIFAARFTAGGVIDSTYGTGGTVYVDLPQGFSGLSAGAATFDGGENLVVAGQGAGPSAYPPTIVVVRLLASGLPDSTFGVSGLARAAVPGYNSGTNAGAVALDSQGRIVVGGGAQDSSAGHGGFLALRLTPSGLLDTGFNATGFRVIDSWFEFGATSMALTASDGILLAGEDDPSSNTPFAIARLTSAGSLDAAFGNAGMVHLVNGQSIATDVNGNVLVASQGAPYPQDTFAVTRLTSAGVLDPSFGAGGAAQVSLTLRLFNPHVRALRLDSAGRVVLGADGFDLNGPALAALRFGATGALDAGFGTSGIEVLSTNSVYGNASVLGVGQGDGLFLANASFVAHLTAAGIPDPTFNGTGSLVHAFGLNQLNLTGMVRQPDGKLVVLGYGGDVWDFQNTNFVVARLTLTGVLDSTFNGTGFRVIDTADPGPKYNSIALDPNGRIVVASRDLDNNFRVVRLLGGGTIDPGFNGTGTVVVADAPIANYQGQHGLAVDSQANILLAAGSVIRLTPAGGLDTAFGVGGKAPLPIPGQVKAFAVDGADRPLIAGDGVVSADFVVARLTNTGVPDPAFGVNGVVHVAPGAGITSAAVEAIALDAGGRILLAGVAQTVGTAVTTIARVTDTGVLDPSFNLTGLSAFPFGFLFPSRWRLILSAGSSRPAEATLRGSRRMEPQTRPSTRAMCSRRSSRRPRSSCNRPPWLLMRAASTWAGRAGARWRWSGSSTACRPRSRSASRAWGRTLPSRRST